MPLRRAHLLAVWTRAHARPVDLLLLACVLILTFPLWWGWLYPPPPAPFAYGAEPFAVSPAALHPGDTPDVEVTRCNRTGVELTYTVSRVVQRVGSGEQWFLPTIGASAPPGCMAVHSKAHTLPSDLPPGAYRLYFTATITPPDGGPPLVSTGRTQDFEVREGGGER
jgi:hypothetical protein